MPRVRVHQHVNPLSPFYRQEPIPLDIRSAFAVPNRPILLDVGCARGRFLLKMAAEQTDWNYLGVEIRHPLVDEANRLASDAGLSNLCYAFCNAMLWLHALLSDIPSGLIEMVTIQFPDPWFKRKHAKRRMVNRELLEAVVQKLNADGRIFIQTDIEFLAEEMHGLLREMSELDELPLTGNPFPVKTEREKAVEDKSLPVYRFLFRKI